MNLKVTQVPGSKPQYRNQSRPTGFLTPSSERKGGSCYGVVNKTKGKVSYYSGINQCGEFVSAQAILESLEQQLPGQVFNVHKLSYSVAPNEIKLCQ